MGGLVPAQERNAFWDLMLSIPGPVYDSIVPSHPDPGSDAARCSDRVPARP